MDMDTIDTILQLLITDKAYYLKKRQDCFEYLEGFLYAIFERDFEFPMADEKHDLRRASTRASRCIPRKRKNQGGEVWVWW